jgi:ribonuclease H2 subunit A
MLEAKGAPCKAEWPDAEDASDNLKLTGFFLGNDQDHGDELADWFGRRVTKDVF